MNIIIPSAGIGQRFQDDGYTMPKPLISVLGEPMIFHTIRGLNLTAEDVLYIPYLQEFDKYQFCPIIKRGFPDINIQFVRVNCRTRGPAETVQIALSVMDLDKPVLICDYDMIFREQVKFQGNYICYFESKTDAPIYSYIKHTHVYIQNADQILEIQEKVKISDSACAGAYGFESGELLKKYCESLLATEHKEYFVSGIYNEMLNDKHFIHVHKIDAFDCVGTPQQLKAYCMYHETKKKRFCFDLDNTLVTYPEVAGDYSTVKPIIKNIKLVQYLHKQGHTIIIQTARKMKTAGHNQGIATRLAYQQIYDTLDFLNIPYDEIYFGKPQADFYIDDLSVKPWDMEKEIGFYNGDIDAREFNRIEYGPEWVIKETNNSGEVYWYKNIPESVKDHFPKMIFKQPLTIEKVNGVNFSYLLCNGSLTKDNLKWLLETLDKVHNCQNGISYPTTLIYSLEDNYTKKIAIRFKDNDYPYPEQALEYFSILHQVKHDPKIGVIHGDPVFSNVFLCDNQLIKFIDMRGKQGGIETIFGDIFYDYAKVYQSLCGYDFILNDMEINHSYLKDLRNYFENWFYERYMVDLAHITAGLLFSLIPLHSDIEKQKKYFELMKTLV